MATILAATARGLPHRNTSRPRTLIRTLANPSFRAEDSVGGHAANASGGAHARYGLSPCLISDPRCYYSYPNFSRGGEPWRYCYSCSLGTWHLAAAILQGFQLIVGPLQQMGLLAVELARWCAKRASYYTLQLAVEVVPATFTQVCLFALPPSPPTPAFTAGIFARSLWLVAMVGECRIHGMAVGRVDGGWQGMDCCLMAGFALDNGV